MVAVPSVQRELVSGRPGWGMLKVFETALPLLYHRFLRSSKQATSPGGETGLLRELRRLGNRSRLS